MSGRFNRHPSGRRRIPLPRRMLIVGIGFVLILGAQALSAVLGPGMIRVSGQVGLTAGDFALRGSRICSGQDRYAELAKDKKLSVTAGNWVAAPALGDGHLVNGRCELPFTVELPRGRGTYVFEARRIARWTRTEADLARHVELTVDPSSVI